MRLAARLLACASRAGPRSASGESTGTRATLPHSWIGRTALSSPKSRTIASATGKSGNRLRPWPQQKGSAVTALEMVHLRPRPGFRGAGPTERAQTPRASRAAGGAEPVREPRERAHLRTMSTRTRRSSGRTTKRTTVGRRTSDARAWAMIAPCRGSGAGRSTGIEPSPLMYAATMHGAEVTSSSLHHVVTVSSGC